MCTGPPLKVIRMNSYQDRDEKTKVLTFNSFDKLKPYPSRKGT
jgi:hypothetical protein